MKLSTLGLQIAMVITGLGMVLTEWSTAQPAGSLSDLDIEYGELKVAFDKIIEDNQQLRDALGSSEKTVMEMRANLAASNGEIEIFKRQAIELKLRIEALGMEAASPNGAKIEQRLLAAVRDLRNISEEKRRLSEALIRLTDAVGAYAKDAVSANPESRLALEVELRNSNAALSGSRTGAESSTALTPTVTDGTVISTKDDLALVVMNVGSKHGVKVGMPFKVQRSGEQIATVRVVDVREEISGAVIQSLKSEKDRIKNGDHLKADTAQQ